MNTVSLWPVELPAVEGTRTKEKRAVGRRRATEGVEDGEERREERREGREGNRR